MLEQGDFVIYGGEQLGGLSGRVSQPLEGLKCAEHEAFFSDLRAGEVEEFVSEDKAPVILAALKVAALLKGGGDAGDGVDGEFKLAGDFRQVEAQSVLAEKLENGKGALGSRGLGILVQRDVGRLGRHFQIWERSRMWKCFAAFWSCGKQLRGA